MKLKANDLIAERGFSVSAAGTVVVGLAGGRKGVAGERCVASTPPESFELIEEKDVLLAWSMSAILGRRDEGDRGGVGTAGRSDDRSSDSSIPCSTSSPTYPVVDRLSTLFFLSQKVSPS